MHGKWHVIFGNRRLRLNAIFQTSYSRSAVIGRAKRMGLAGPRSREPAEAIAGRRGAQSAERRRSTMRPNAAADFSNPANRSNSAVSTSMPRHLSLIDLLSSDCRYPYGGDEEGEPSPSAAIPAVKIRATAPPHFQIDAEHRAASEGRRTGETARRPWRPHGSKRAIAIPPALPRRHRGEKVICAAQFQETLQQGGDKMSITKRKNRTVRNGRMTGDPAICRATPKWRRSKSTIRWRSSREKDRHAALDPQRSTGAAAHPSPDRRGAIPRRARLPGRLGEGRARPAGRRSLKGICRWRAGAEPITERQRKAVLRLNRAERELGADGSALVHEILVLGMTMEQIGQRRGLRSQRWIDYFARRFRECLDRLALMYGFAAEAGTATRQRPAAINNSSGRPTVAASA